MSGTRATRLLAALDGAGMGDRFQPRDAEGVARLEFELGEVMAALSDRGVAVDVVDAIEGARERMLPFLESFATPMTAPIRALVYFLLLGAEILELEVRYDRQARFHLAVLAQLHPGHTSRFLSDDLWDAEFLRHLGLLKVSGRPVIDGYYAFRR